MSTIVLIVKDTIASCDTAVVKLATIAENYQPIVRNAETNYKDVAIVFFICAAIVVMALIAKCAVLSWKSKEIKAAKDERTEQKLEKADERTRKQKNDLIEKLLDFLKKQTEETNEKGEMVGVKSYNQEECKAYEKVLRELIAEMSDKIIDVPQDDSNNPPQNQVL